MAHFLQRKMSHPQPAGLAADTENPAMGTFYKVSYLALYPQNGEGLTFAGTAIELTAQLGTVPLS